MSGGRRHPRTPVMLAVRFAVAEDFVLEYAENLSRGGLFLAGAEHLAPRDEVRVEIDLPGFGTFVVRTEVAHVLGARTRGGWAGGMAEQQPHELAYLERSHTRRLAGPQLARKRSEILRFRAGVTVRPR